MSTPHSLTQVNPLEGGNDVLRVVVETPKGCRNKYKYVEKLGCFQLHKTLPLGASFPFDFGFIPSTRGEDGDPLDILILMDEAAFPGCIVPVRLLGAIEANQSEKGKTTRNDRLIAVLETVYNPSELRSLSDIGENRLGELEHFFVSYNQVEGRGFEPIRRQGPRQAMELVKEGMRRFHDKAK